MSFFRFLFLGILCFAAFPLAADSVRFFRAISDSFDAPEGLFELASPPSRNIPSYYEIRRDERGRVTRIECHVPQWTNAPGGWRVRTFQYDESGCPTRSCFYGAGGAPLLIWHYLSPDDIVFERAAVETVPAAFLPVHEYSYAVEENADSADCVLPRGSIGGVRLTRDASGRIERAMYRRKQNTEPACDSQYIAGQSYKYDSYGRITRVSWLDRDGRMRADRYGVASIHAAYRDACLWRISFSGADGRSVPCARDFDSVVFEYDAAGRETARHFFANGDPVTDRQTRCAVTRGWYNVDGELIRMQNFDPDRKPCPDADNIWSVRVIQDPSSSLVFQMFLNSVTHDESDPGRRLSYDTAGLLRRYEYRKADGSPAERRDSVSVYSYNEQGEMTGWELFDAKGMLTERCHRRVSPDASCETLRLEKPDGSVRVRTIRYDEYGNRLLLLRSGANSLGSVRFVYNKDGLLRREIWLDADGKPGSGEPVCGYEYRYDSRGCRIARRSVGVARRAPGKLVYRSGDGVFEIRYDYDIRGNCVREAFYSSDGQPEENSCGVHSVTRTFDGRGNETECGGYRLSGAPCSLDDERVYALVRRRFDLRNRVVAELFLDSFGEPVPAPDVVDSSDDDSPPDGFPAIILSAYDLDNRPILVDWFAADKPGSLLGVPGAYHYRNAKSFGKNGVSRECMSFFDVDGRPVLFSGNASQMNIVYRNGEKIALFYLDPDGHPALSADGYAGMHLTDGKKIYFDASGKPVEPVGKAER